MRLLILGLLVVSASARRFASDSGSSSVEDDVTESRLILSKSNFDRDSYLKTKPSRLAESLSGTQLVDYVNSRQDLWTATADNKFSKYTDAEKRALMGVNHVQNSIFARRNLASSRHSNSELPDSFDAR